ncbi:DUF305 domain-containing protein [Patulibacter sp.]|uniref:DUF305 domain-containing protein n=1 Tax=Patulibacter sp. TaxID=1912859 RepID=UPI002716366C|nr:DUF305 domain-containing protein [Patulibacter sp.]MDO9408021.1 DUF305 domain-containing protein [Patulibacter sp.]
MKTSTTRLAALLGVTATTALAVTGCGAGDDDAGTTPASTAAGAAATAPAAAGAVDRAFVSQMIPHHQMAVRMAGYAPDRAERQQITTLARSITEEQNTEIARMRSAARRLGAKVAAVPAHGSMDHGAHDASGMSGDAATLGVSMDDMGMSMDMGALGTAKPFDRAFIDEMIPHHQGAITMARTELARGTDPELRRLATAIVDAQSQEIRRMNEWRARWYGAPSPAGGVPKA